MSASSSKQALVVGAGIGGLAAAVALKRTGFSVTVLEQAPQLREVGFALLLAPNAMRALRLLGVADAVLAGGGVARTGQMRRLDGRVLKSLDVRELGEVLGENTVCAFRPVLHGALGSALGEGSVRAGARLVSFAQDPEGVTAILEGGEELRADLLIGADGIHSTVQRLLHGESALRQSGLFGVRGVTRSAAFDAGDGAQFFGAGIEAGVGCAGSSGVYWYVSVPQKLRRDSDAAPKPWLLSLLTARKADPALLRLIEHTAPTDLRVDPLADREPLARWGRERVTLLGDAAHPMLPHAGQGAAQALEDAVVLGQTLQNSEDLSAALMRYEEARRPRSAQFVRLSRRNAGVAQLSNPIACALRNQLIRLIPPALVVRQLLAIARPPF